MHENHAKKIKKQEVGFRWLVKKRASDWERQRLAGRRRAAPPEPPKPAGRMPAFPVAVASFDEPPKKREIYFAKNSPAGRFIR